MAVEYLNGGETTTNDTAVKRKQNNNNATLRERGWAGYERVTVCPRFCVPLLI